MIPGLNAQDRQEWEYRYAERIAIIMNGMAVPPRWAEIEAEKEADEAIRELQKAENERK